MVLQHTTLQRQLSELIGDLAASLSSRAFSKSSKKSGAAFSTRIHYDALEMCAVCLCLVTAHSTDSRVSDTESASPHGSLVSTLAYLMEPRHPARFRAFFSRVLVAVSPLYISVCILYRSNHSQNSIISQQICMKPDGKSALESSEIATMRILCSSVFDLYKDSSEFRHVESALTDEIDSFNVMSIRRIAAALNVLLESSAALRQLVVVKRGLQFCTGAIKESFHAIRMEGGFGGKAKHPREDHLVSLCARIEIHFDVLAALVGGDASAQEIAMVRV